MTERKASRVATQLVEKIIDWTGKYTPWNEEFINNFEFKLPHTALSSLFFPIGTLIFYCIFIPALERFMKNRRSPPLKYILIVHNLFLSGTSAILFVIMALKMISLLEQNRPYSILFCEVNFEEQKGLLTFTYYLNHLLKYYELFDTLFLALKKKPIGFLHAYHHPATLVLTWGQLVDTTGVQWIVIFLNLFVHVIMYFYFAMASMSVEMPFKRLITILQISQFILDLFACFWAYFIFLVDDQCFGRERAAVVGCFILTSYLYLFVDFYNETYSKDNLNKKVKLGDKKE